ncbi:LEA type 2 family protein [Teredinibacter purpureus]|uniref:LEA type 2 family protein n=1 Tax=Teredinibacter purpureus TaxID=2731756 RepID=UPI0005F77C58|nr:LEA type 2 family protein [Teredinibacter purpureus]
MKSESIIIVLLLACTLLCSCSTLELEQPQVSITSISPPKTQGMEALIDLHMRISNPNGIPLPLKGMSYELAINDTGLLKGVSSTIANIPAYGSKDFTVQLSVNLFSAPKLLYSLMKNPQQHIRYSFTTKIDLQGLLPSFYLVDEGQLPLSLH